MPFGLETHTILEWLYSRCPFVHAQWLKVGTNHGFGGHLIGSIPNLDNYHLAEWTSPDQARPVQDCLFVVRSGLTSRLDRTVLSPTPDRVHPDWWKHCTGLYCLVLYQYCTHYPCESAWEPAGNWKPALEPTSVPAWESACEPAWEPAGEPAWESHASGGVEFSSTGSF